MAAMAPYAFIAAVSAMKAFGAWYQGKSEAESLKYQARAHEANAQQLKLNAQAKSAETSAAEDAQRRRVRMSQGQAFAAVGSTGTQLEGSNADIINQSGAFGELDALNIRYEGEMQRRSLLAQSNMETFAGKGSRSASKSAMRAGWIGAGTALMSGAASAYGYKTGKV